jgi:hypothetical protein
LTWTVTSAAILSLQTLLNDGPTDKLGYLKPPVGDINGTNVQFKTFEFRRVTNFAPIILSCTMNGTTAVSGISSTANLVVGAPVAGTNIVSGTTIASIVDANDITLSVAASGSGTNNVYFGQQALPQGLYLSGALIAPNGVITDDVVSGAFTLASAPTASSTRQTLQAIYYYQWFESSELDSFLQNASNWLTYGSTYINIPDGLNMALLRFAASQAYLKLSAKYATRLSAVYKLEDGPSEDILKSVQAWQSMADSYMKSAEQMRDDYYTRAGQSLQPLYQIATGRVRDPVPRR